jgi:hypothetical protein
MIDITLSELRFLFGATIGYTLGPTGTLQPLSELIRSIQPFWSYHQLQSIQPFLIGATFVNLFRSYRYTTTFVGADTIDITLSELSSAPIDTTFPLRS